MPPPDGRQRKELGTTFRVRGRYTEQQHVGKHGILRLFRNTRSKIKKKKSVTLTLHEAETM